MCQAYPTASQTLKPVYDSNGQPIYVPSSDLAASQTLKPACDSNGQPIYVPSSTRRPRRP